ncbi:MAG: phosphoglycerate mutase (2,3-diphosphoglycerate-independent) [Gammaproteobacteria bacterium 39-13]|mgnify:CR=1 FL=1|nr:2,3-bisphosphoglycerate-independent phosphoglycerate mutase [Gammaproteobacteria bacterium]OJV90590.1 MAG: phosphoglycerate mutase (2,3-diphosphoglycerate-independent) [Gammaproteobacteria bacterium 39-13]
MTRCKPVVLLILDGWGHRLNGSDNAIHAAHTPTWDTLIKNRPHTLISGCGEDVGLPMGQMGNSEVGHLTMGAGRVIYQDLTLVTKKIRDKEFFQNPVLLNAFKRARETNKAVHIMGLLSPGGVHSHEDHLFACLEMAKQNAVPRLYVHAFLDGRDTPPQSAKASLEKLDHELKKTNAQLASVSGRYYAMDRDKRWERVASAYNAIVHGQSTFYAPSGIEALNQAYARQETDEFVTPTCIVQENQHAISIESGDIVVYMNFRADRARALSYAMTEPLFDGFSRGNYPTLGEFVSLTEYDKNLKTSVVFKPQIHRNVLGEYLQNQHLTQLHLAETEKYAHVTFFFNGGIEAPFQGEERILIPSPKVATYDLKPEMSAFEVTEALVENILEKKFDFIVCNYANADMVGHTGNFAAAKKAIETLDQCLHKVIDALESAGGEALITSDHGNAECMQDNETGQAHTAHTTNLVPLIYIGKQKVHFKKGIGTLSNVAPTLLSLMHLEKPIEMTGDSLLES